MAIGAPVAFIGSSGSPIPSDFAFPKNSEVTFRVVERPSSADPHKGVPQAMMRDLHEYGSALYECIDGYSQCFPGSDYQRLSKSSATPMTFWRSWT